MWTVEQAQERFSDLLTRCETEGPQFLTREGVKVAVMVSISDWDRVKPQTEPTLKDLLLADEPRFNDLVPPGNRDLGIKRRESAVDQMLELMSRQEGLPDGAITGDQISEWRDHGKK